MSATHVLLGRTVIGRLSQPHALPAPTTPVTPDHAIRPHNARWLAACLTPMRYPLTRRLSHLAMPPLPKTPDLAHQPDKFPYQHGLCMHARMNVHTSMHTYMLGMCADDLDLLDEEGFDDDLDYGFDDYDDDDACGSMNGAIKGTAAAAPAAVQPDSQEGARDAEAPGRAASSGVQPTQGSDSEPLHRVP